MIIKKITCFTHILAFLVVNIPFSAQPADQQAANKTKEQLDALITSAGSSKPDWWDSVELNVPATLEKDWPIQDGVWEGRGNYGPAGTRGQRGVPGQRGMRGAGRGQIPNNVDQYLLQVVYPNSSQHKQGIKLVYELMETHKDSPDKYKRDMDTLAYLYYDLVMDYARAAYWWQKYSQAGGTVDSMKVARCFYELGSKAAAEEVLSKADTNNRNAIKLWATIGEVDKALEMVGSYTPPARARRGRRGGAEENPQVARDMLAAEICREAGRYDKSIEYYKKVAASQTNTPVQPNLGGRGRGEQGRSLQSRAQANFEAVELIKVLDLTKVPDGTYTDTAAGHEGNLVVSVTISNAKIQSVEVTQQSETPNRYAMAENITRRLVSKQGFEGVDAITGATETSDAIINAVVKAIVKAMK